MILNLEAEVCKLSPVHISEKNGKKFRHLYLNLINENGQHDCIKVYCPETVIEHTNNIMPEQKVYVKVNMRSRIDTGERFEYYRVSFKLIYLSTNNPNNNKYGNNFEN